MGRSGVYYDPPICAAPTGLLTTLALARHMDFSVLFDPEYLPIIVGTIVGFGLLAAALLVPVYRFLEREQKVAQKWTPDALAERMRNRKKTTANGTEADDDDAVSTNGASNSSTSPD